MSHSFIPLTSVLQLYLEKKCLVHNTILLPVSKCQNDTGIESTTVPVLPAKHSTNQAIDIFDATNNISPPKRTLFSCDAHGVA